MKPAPFAYHAPATLEEALELLDRHGFDAKALAGGQSLVPAMNFRLAAPAVLVDLNRIGGLAGVHPEGKALRLGAMVRQRTLETHPLIASHAPLLAETMPHVAHVQIRNRGTLGGSLAHADPASELPAVLVALGARFRCRSVRGERWVPAPEFFLGLFATALEPGELLVEVELPPRSARSGWAFDEVARRHGDYALAGAVAGVRLDEAGRCQSARLVLMGVGEGPVTIAEAGSLLEGQAPTPDLVRAVGEAARVGVDPSSDIHASAAYRRHLAGVLARRVMTRACTRAGAAGLGGT